MKHKFLTFLIAILISIQGLSSHFAGGNIYYDCLGSNQYRIWTEITLDCNGASNPTSISITPTNTCGLTNPTINLSLISSQTKNVSQVCFRDSLLTSCINSSNSLQGRRRYLYSAVVTLPACNNWTFGWSSCCRNGGASGVVNLSTAGSIYLETKMFSANDSCNNSVRYTGVQNPYVCINQPASYNFGAVDPDGDSLAYVLIPAMTGAGTFSPYNVPYSGQNPISGIVLDSATGTITFTPNTLGSFVVVVQVTEYDTAGNILAITMRDIQVVVYNCVGNIPPDPASTFLYNVTGQGTVAGPKRLEVCEGDSFCVDFQVYDSNALDTLTLWSTNLSSVLPGATLSYTGTNPITGTLCWSVPTNASTINAISLTVDDGYCPIPARASFSLIIEVIKSTYVSPDVTICLGDSTLLSVQGGSSFNWASISGPALNVGTNFNCDTCQPAIAKPVATTIYEVTSDLSGGCKNKDTVTVTVASNFNYILTQTGTSSCKLDPIGFNITPITPDTYTYLWTPSSMLSANNISNPILNPTQSGLFNYIITVANSQGCIKYDTTSVFVSNGVKPNIRAFTDKDTIICNDIANLVAWVDTAASVSNLRDDFDNALSPFAFVSNITGGLIGTGCGANSLPNSLNFNGSGTRELRSSSIQVGNCSQITYSIRLGNAASGFACDNVENTDPVYFQYSINNGMSWVNLRTHSYLGWLVTTGWQTFTAPMPVGATNIMFRWHQPVHGGVGQDNWALDDIQIDCSSLNNYTYNWSPSVSLSTPNATNTTAKPDNGTNYQLIVTDTTGGCSDTAYVLVETLTDYPVIDIEIDTNNGCIPVSVTFTNNTDTTRIGTIEWDFGDGTTGTSLANQLSHTYINPGTYSVYVKITSPNGCVSDTTYINIVEVYDIPVAFFGASPQPTNISNSTVNFSDLSSNFATQWYWNFGINLPGYPTNSLLQNPSIKYPDLNSGVYPVTLIVGSANGCFDTTSQTIIIDGLYTLYLANSFTPNGNGLNDEFGPSGEKIDPVNYKFMIFNRWGEMVYSTTNIKDKWNGRLNNSGDLLPEGNYIWRIIAADGNTGEDHEYIGHVILLRKIK
ncbi:gliding motility-associated C-terminal domain-containing protein [bacterium]|nr:gliding motility-associated C-terminal domain-containing protein [bacterium]